VDHINIRHLVLRIDYFTHIHTVSRVVNFDCGHFRDLLVLGEPLNAGLEGLCVVVLEPRVVGVFNAIFLEEVHVVHLFQVFLGLFLDLLELLLTVFIFVIVDLTDSRLVDSWSGCFACELDVLLETGALEAVLVIDKLHHIGDGFLWLQETVFVADDVDWDA